MNKGPTSFFDALNLIQSGSMGQASGGCIGATRPLCQFAHIFCGPKSASPVKLIFSISPI